MDNYEVNNFQKDVIERSDSIPVLVDFWAEWCGPCKFLGPIIEKLAREADGKWELVKVNTEINQELATSWGIRGIPNLKLFYKGEVIENLSGAMAEPEMRRWLEDKLPSPAKALLMEAEKCVALGDNDLAQEKLSQVLAIEPEMKEARLAYARIVLWKDPLQARELVKDLMFIEEAAEIWLVTEAMTLEEDSLEDDVSKTALLEGLKCLKNDRLDDFFNSFIRAIMLNRGYNDEFARRMVVALFHLLGESNEITKRYRRRFDMALY